MSIAEILKRLAEWSSPHEHEGEPGDFELRCTVEPGPADVAEGWVLPEALTQFWREASGARLFEDVRYGQWGLVLLSPTAAQQRSAEFKDERHEDWKPGDLVVGEFLGDQELLIVRCEPESPDFGRVLVSLPIYRRHDWFAVAPDLAGFLKEYEQVQGEKFWEEAERRN